MNNILSGFINELEKRAQIVRDKFKKDPSKMKVNYYKKPKSMKVAGYSSPNSIKWK